ncbi:hypothetical protein [Paenibacillus paeoniae]|nr:hypothetical protein [Paenibacillus paeoniae]
MENPIIAVDPQPDDTNVWSKQLTVISIAKGKFGDKYNAMHIGTCVEA